jgi:flagellar protein FliS
MMKRNLSEISYQRAAIEGASSIGLMIVLFDALTGDLRRAADALRKNDIETRCRELNHAALVLGQLESWLDLPNGGEGAQTLSRFYAYLRAKMIEAGVHKSAAMIENLIEMILHVRTAWQKLDTIAPQASQVKAIPTTEQANPYSTQATETQAERIPFSQSA